MKKTRMVCSAIVASLFIIGGCGGNTDNDDLTIENESTFEGTSVSLDGDDYFIEQDEISMNHIHGLGFAGNENIIYFATDHGLILYDNGKWFETDQEQNDYLDFNAVEGGFYASIQQDENTNFDVENRLGLVKSVDGGKNVDHLDLLDETDFRVVGTSYYTNAVYIYNIEPNNRMEETGLYYTLDDGDTWTKSAMQGLPDVSNDEGNHHDFVLSVHPRNENALVIGTDDGLFLSDDYGDHFHKSELDLPITSLASHEDDVLAAVSTGEMELVRLRSEGDTIPVELPRLDEQDQIQYISVNPNDDHEIVVTTFSGDSYHTLDHGVTWVMIMEDFETAKVLPY